VLLCVFGLAAVYGAPNSDCSIELGRLRSELEMMKDTLSKLQGEIIEVEDSKSAFSYFKK
jgi:hypothetical protein